MDNIIEVQSLRKSYKELVAVKSLSFEVKEGEFLSLLGASGCGKTTTLRMIAGLEQPNSGQMFFRGEDITQRPPARRNMRMVFQDFALFPNLSVWENVAFGLRLRIQRGRTSTAEIQSRVGKMLEIVQLSGHAEKAPHQLSGGQKQRVALARALVTDPPVVLFDEPLGSLDAAMRKTMQLELKRLHRDLQKTFIYVTHDQEEAMGLSNRVAVMQGGEILQLSPPEEIYARPISVAVAKFVGTANILAGTVESSGQRAWVHLSGGAKLPLGNEWRKPTVAKSTAFMVRAEKVRIDGTDGQSSESLRAKVVERLFLGEKIRYELELLEGGLRLTVLDGSRARDFAVNDVVSLTVDPADIHVIDDKSAGKT